jgi:hypothetical protein
VCDNLIVSVKTVDINTALISFIEYMNINEFNAVFILTVLTETIKLSHTQRGCDN